MSTCAYASCSQPVAGGKKFCSVTCSNKGRQRSRKCADGVSICSLKTCNDCQDRRPKSTRTCANQLCGRSFDAGPLRRGGVKRYCSRRCGALGQHNSDENIARWLAGEDIASVSAGRTKNGEFNKNLAAWARNYLLEEADWKCTRCGWNEPHPLTGRPPLEIDHIDGNRRNNARTNLVVLCPNCHSLTTTYRRYNYKNVQTLKDTVWGNPA